MSPKRVWCVVLILSALLSACGKKSESVSTPAAQPAATAAEKATPPAPKPEVVNVVVQGERSPSFLAVNRHLELGGTLYGYIDIEGDVEKIAAGLKELLGHASAMQPQLKPIVDKDLVGLTKTLGLTDVKAIGISSVPDGSGFFRNRAFFYTPGERHGLLLGLGGAAKPFKHLKLAPADTALYAEAEVDVPVVYKTIRDVITAVAGEPAGNQLEAALKRAGENASLSFLDLIHGLKGNSALVLRVDPNQALAVPGGFKLPAFSLLVCIEGVAPVLEPSLAKSPLLKRTEQGGLRIYQFTQPSPIPQLQPVLVADGTTLFFATSQAFLDECRAGKTSLAQDAEFQQAMAAVGNEGNGMTYLHPRVFDTIRKVVDLNPNLPPQARPTIALVLSKVPKTDRPIVAIRTNLADGVLVRSHWHRSMKQELAMVAFYNPVSVGLVAAMAIPAFQKVRASSQEKAVLNNLRQLAAAADQYYLEKGVTAATYEDLVGPEEDKYIKEMRSVVGEDYSQLTFEQGEPLVIELPDGRMVTYGGE